MYVIQVKIHLFALYGLFRLIYDNLYIKHIKISIQAKYESHICIYYTIFSIYSQYILIYNIDKTIKRGDAHKKPIPI